MLLSDELREALLRLPERLPPPDARPPLLATLSRVVLLADANPFDDAPFLEEVVDDDDPLLLPDEPPRVVEELFGLELPLEDALPFDEDEPLLSAELFVADEPPLLEALRPPDELLAAVFLAAVPLDAVPFLEAVLDDEPLDAPPLDEDVDAPPRLLEELRPEELPPRPDDFFAADFLLAALLALTPLLEEVLEALPLADDLDAPFDDAPFLEAPLDDDLLALPRLAPFEPDDLDAALEELPRPDVLLDDDFLDEDFLEETPLAEDLFEELPPFLAAAFFVAFAMLMRFFNGLINFRFLKLRMI